MSSFSLHLGESEDSQFLHGDPAFAPFLEWVEEMAMSSRIVAMEE